MDFRAKARGDVDKRNGNIQRKMPPQNVVQKPFVVHNVSKPSPQLSDKNEFPSLNEISGKLSSNSPTPRRTSKYSEKLKLQQTSNPSNKKIAANIFHSMNESITSCEPTYCTPKYQYSNSWTLQKINSPTRKSSEPSKFIDSLNKNVDYDSLSQYIPRSPSHSSKNNCKNQSPKKNYAVNNSNSKLSIEPVTLSIQDGSITAGTADFSTNYGKTQSPKKNCAESTSKLSKTPVVSSIQNTFVVTDAFSMNNCSIRSPKKSVIVNTSNSKLSTSVTSIKAGTAKEFNNSSHYDCPTFWSFNRNRKHEKNPVNSSSSLIKGNTTSFCFSTDYHESESNNSSKESYASKFDNSKTQSPILKHHVNTISPNLCATNDMPVINQSYSSLFSKSNNQAQLNGKMTSNVKNNSLKVKRYDKSNNQAQTNIRMNSNIKNNAVTDKGNDSSKEPKKKKRKSKVKRQVALQTGKITVLTPEVHSKILNQTSSQPVKTLVKENIWTDINNEEEYPELGKPLVPVSQKENVCKQEGNITELTHETTKIDSSTDEEQQNIKGISEESMPLSPIKSDEKSTAEIKGKNENKPVRPNDPITVSFYDILVNKSSKAKVKLAKAENDASFSITSMKIKDKKSTSHSLNLLDSSSPVKRGKEREKPKAKRPTLLKRIILLDRQLRKEQLLQLKGNGLEEQNAVNGFENKLEVNALENGETDIIETNIISENDLENSSSSMLPLQIEVCKEDNVLFSLDDSSQNLCDDMVSDMKIINVSEINDTEDNERQMSLITISAENVETEQSCEKVLLDKLSNKKKHANSEIKGELPLITQIKLNLLKLPDRPLSSYIGHDQLQTSDKEKAVKVLLHTRNFREYCNHLISEEIDCTVFALLDDLARFQDRLHQKDPVKARMKRRMVYGVKEVKKHAVINKLKCIIVAADIENIETHGGLNDLLNDLKGAATNHHIPCVFALSRKKLGKVCHKPVPVSCVGIFNYEGSETNFKKMIELQTQSKADYAEITSKLSQTVTEDQVAELLKARKEAPETLREIRESILSDFFLESKTESFHYDKPESEKESDSSDTEA